jgi:flagellar biosynthesis chaperone FliJ
MTSVLYSGGLNYQSGNPVRQEIVTVRRDVDTLRKQVEMLSEENLIYRKHLMKALQPSVDGQSDNSAEFLQDLMALSNSVDSKSKREAGNATVQGGGFRR